MSRLEMDEAFDGRRVIVSGKQDGENTSMYRDHYHVRSVDSRPHPSQNWCRQLHALIRHDIPENWRVVGENLFATHAIHYDRLPTFFMVFSIWDDKNVSLPWDDTVEYTKLLNSGIEGTGMSLQTVPVLYDGIWDEGKVRACYTGESPYGGVQEGYVVRVADAILYPVPEENDKHQMPVFKTLAKFVRKGHVEAGSEHWRRTWTPNQLAK